MDDVDPNLRSDVGDPMQIRFGGKRLRGKPVFRLVKTRMIHGLVAGGTIGALAGAAAGAAVPPLVLGASFVAGVLGALLGNRLHADECTECGGVLAVGADQCKRCDARIAGSIRRRSELVDAEERYRKELVARRKAGLEEDEEPESSPPSSEL